MKSEKVSESTIVLPVKEISFSFSNCECNFHLLEQNIHFEHRLECNILLQNSFYLNKKPQNSFMVKSVPLDYPYKLFGSIHFFTFLASSISLLLIPAVFLFFKI